MKGIMMIYTSTETSKIKKNTFMQIIRAIYFKYYQRWYDVFLDADSKIKYNEILNESYSKMENGLKDKNYIEINGFNDFFNSGTDTGYNIFPSKKVKLITGIILFLFWTIFIGFLYIFVNKKFGFDVNTLSTIFYASLLISLFFLSLFFDKKSKILSKIINKLFDK
jgi:hypothetical protein